MQSIVTRKHSETSISASRHISGNFVIRFRLRRFELEIGSCCAGEAECMGTNMDMTGEGVEKWGNLALWDELLGFVVETLEGGIWESTLDITSLRLRRDLRLMSPRAGCTACCFG
jgi:hypothetical protein